MAPISAPKVLATKTFSRPFLFFTLSVLMHYCSSEATHQPAHTTKMVLYFHDIFVGPNANFIPVTGIAGKLWTFSQFGTLYVGDDFATETTNPNSTMIAHGQGIYVISSLDGLSIRSMFSIVFTNRAYNGSTLEVEGTVKQLGAVREYSVVGGTGQFRFARGYTTFETISADTTQAVTRCNITVRHD